MKFTEFNSGKKTNLLAYKKKISLFLFAICIVLSSASIYGQNVIHESELHKENGILSNGIDIERLTSLLYEANSAVYFQNGEMNYYGENPVVLYVDFEQLGSIPMQSRKLQNVELVKIYMKTNSPQQINSEVFRGLPNLEYVFLACDRCTASNLRNLFTSSEKADFTKNILTVFNSDEKQ